MMKKILHSIFLFLFFVASAQKNDSNSAVIKEKLMRQDTIVLSTPSIIQIKQVSDKQTNGFDWSKNMPWIGAILIGLTTVVANIIISAELRKSNSAVTKQQIENSRNIATEQISAATKNSERDFKKTVLSTSRQLWVNDFRFIISELLSITAIFSFKQVMNDENHYKFNLLITKSELMLSNYETHLELKKSLDELKTACLGLMMGNDDTLDELNQIVDKIKRQTIIILNAEWEKASRAE